MPIYEYRCTQCGRRFEHLQSRRENSSPHCPACGDGSTERLLSTFAVAKAREAPAATGPCGSSDCACLRQDHTTYS
jgi:putative FmdB family regulatory protein